MTRSLFTCTLSVALLAAAVVPALAQEERQPSVDRTGGHIGGLVTTTGVKRHHSAAEGDVWREYSASPGPLGKTPIPPAVAPAMRPWLMQPPPTKTGPLTGADLDLEPAPGGYQGDRPGYRVVIADDGTIEFDDRTTLDLTDVVVRRQGGDPYAHDKRVIREMTEPARREANDQERQLAITNALLELPARLNALWAAPWPVEQRRAAIFALWDELLEGGPSAEGAAGASARVTIEDFVREHLPPGSDEAYPAAELEALNHGRLSRAPFAPYRQTR